MTAVDRQYGAATRVYQDVTRWKKELTEAGWKQEHATLWVSATGHYFRGPYLAWCVMRGIPMEHPNTGAAK